MSYKVEISSYFEKDFKKLAKKYHSLKSDLTTLIKRLVTTPKQGTPIGKNCYKIRLAIKSKGKGKSSGARVITHIAVSAYTIYLLTIYDKSDKKNITDKELDELFQFIP